MKKQDILENQVKQSYLAIGSNLGNKITNINIAMFELEKNKIKIKKVHLIIYQNPGQTL